MTARTPNPWLNAVALASDPDDLRDPPPGAEIWRDRDGRVDAVTYTRDGLAFVHVSGVGTFEFDETAEEVRVRSLRGVPSDVVADAFRRMVLPIVVHVRGDEVLHASAVSSPRGVIAFCGASGAGKSTFAYAMSVRGYPVCADDAVAVDLSGEPPRVMGLPFRLRLRAPAVEWFDVPGEHSSPVDAGAPGEPLATIYVLQRDNVAEPMVEVLPSADAFLALLPHAYYLALDAESLTRRLIENYLDLAARVRVSRLRLPDSLDALDSAAALVADIAERAG